MAAVNEAEAVGDFLKAGDLDALALLERLDEQRRIHQRMERPGVEPSKAATHARDFKTPGLQIAFI